MHIPRARTVCLQAIFGDYLGAQLAKQSDPELRRVVLDDDHPLVGDLGPSHRRRLAGVLGLADLWRVAAWVEPPFLRSEADVFAHMFDRTRHGHERRVWVLCLDPDDALQDEVLAQCGGVPDVPTPARVLLRHAIRMAATSIYVVESMGVWRPRVGADTCTAFQALREVGEQLGISVNGWLVIARDGAIWVREDTPTEDLSTPAHAA